MALASLISAKRQHLPFPTPGTAIAVFAVLIPLFAQGCASSKPLAHPPATLSLRGLDYESCFDEVVRVARDSGMPAVLRDRSGGLIETAPRISGSIFEPWRQDNASFGEGVENTIAFQRRRARFEFVPVDFMPPPPGDPDELEGTPLPGAKDDHLVDMRTYEGPIEVRIWVYVERAFTPGMRNGTWTRSQTTFAIDRLAPTSRRVTETALDRSKWTPVRRDEPYERILLESLDKRLDAGPRAS